MKKIFSFIFVLFFRIFRTFVPKVPKVPVVGTDANCSWFFAWFPPSSNYKFLNLVAQPIPGTVVQANKLIRNKLI
jgi:hypothetical protein